MSRIASVRRAALLLVALGVSASPSLAEKMEFLIGDPLKLDSASIEIDSKLLPLRGHVGGFTGSARFDPEQPEMFQADVEIPFESLFLGSFLVTEEILSERWLDATAYPTARLNIKGIKDMTEFTDNTWSFTARTALVLKGRAGGAEFPATVTYIPNGMTERTDGKIDGDLLVVRGELSFRRSMWGIDPESAIVPGLGDVVDMEFTAIGYTMRSGRK